MSYSPNFRGTTATAGARRLETDYLNGTGFTLAKGTPVGQDLTGKLALIDITSDSSVANILGIVSMDAPAASMAPVVDAGRLEALTTTFSIGDAIYIGLDGLLINVAPSAVGDYVIYVGTVVANQYDSSKKDIKLGIVIRGQL